MREYSYIKRSLLRELSENSRASVTNLAKKLKCSRNTVISNMRALNKEFQIHYTLELDRAPLGIDRNQMMTIKFEKKPTAKEINEIFKDDPLVRLVAQTEGNFDLLINMISGSGEEYTYWGMNTAIKLLPFRPKIKQSSVAMAHTGFIPVLTKSLEKMDFGKASLDELDKKIILLLNDDSRMTYNAMAKKLHENVETIRYRMRKISKSKIIKRFTLVFHKLPTQYNICFLVNYKLAPGLLQRYKNAYGYYLGLDEKLPVMNSFQYIALTNGSYMLFGIGCFENEEQAIENAVEAQKRLFKEDSPEISYARIIKVIRGHIPARSTNIAKEFNPLRLK